MADEYEEIWSEYLWEEPTLDSEDGDDGPLTDGPPEVVDLAAEHPGFLVLSGGQSGSVVSTPPSDAVTRDGKAPRIPSREDALSGLRPLFLLTVGAKSPADGREVLTALHTEYGRNLAIGVSGSIPRHTVKKISGLFECAVAALRIADPEYHLIEHDKLVLAPDDPTEYKNQARGDAAERTALSRRARAPYLGNRGENGFVESILQIQRDLGANLLLTSGAAIDPANVSRSLDDLTREGDEVLALLEGQERMALSLTLPWECLTNQRSIELILGELLERDQFDTWYVRAQWKSNSEGPHLRDVTALGSYKEMCNLAADEERILILPQTGLTGWYMLAHGATGFGTGTAALDQGLFQYKQTARPPGTTPLQYFFEKTLMHTVEFSTHLAIEKERGYLPCACRFCRSIEQSGVFNGTRAQWHGVFNHGMLTAAVQRDARRSGPPGAARRLLRAAKKFTTSQALVGRDDPKHLDAWLSLL